ncbi:hypothetical protein V6N11_075539 [Hibiscus sabdariffa]|uniref:Uncharacterized protein n=1 Tax=Hibiscus sabdariffa TaxID=183260 RepID=A0ABR2R6T1_9ROSI
MHHRFLPALLWEGTLKEHRHSGNAPRLEKHDTTVLQARLGMLALTLSIDIFFGVKTNRSSSVKSLPASANRDSTSGASILSRISQHRLRLWSQHPVMEHLYKVHHQLY